MEDTVPRPAESKNKLIRANLRQVFHHSMWNIKGVFLSNNPDRTARSCQVTLPVTPRANAGEVKEEVGYAGGSCQETRRNGPGSMYLPAPMNHEPSTSITILTFNAVLLVNGFVE